MSIWDMDSHKQVAMIKTVTDFVEARDQAVSHWEDSLRCISLAEDTTKAITDSLSLTVDMKPRLSREQGIRYIDRKFWHHSFDVAGFFTVMDQQARDDFWQSMLGREDFPAFTMDNIRTTFLSYLSEAQMIFKRGIVNVFKGLSDGYWHNNREPFCIAEKVIMCYMIDRFMGMSIRYEKSATINDIDRVVKVLDGKEHNQRELETLINQSLKDDYTAPYEDEYYKIRCFKNGNIHLTFKRRDLLDQINLLIAEYYGENVLADGKAA